MKITKKLDIYHLIMILLIIFLLVLLGNSYSSNQDMKNLNRNIQEEKLELEKQVEELEEEVKINYESLESHIYELSKEFIEQLNHGTHMEYLSTELREEIIKNIDSTQEDSYSHGYIDVDVNVRNISVFKKEDKHEVYAIYEVVYYSRHEVTNVQAPNLREYYTIYLEWVTEDDDYVVSNYKINYLIDNFYDYLDGLESSGD